MDYLFIKFLDEVNNPKFLKKIEKCFLVLIKNVFKKSIENYSGVCVNIYVISLSTLFSKFLL